MAIVRLIVSGLVAFIFYALWAWYANSLVVTDSAVLTKAALVQGGYSGAMTLLFTGMLEYFFKKFGTSTLCLGLLAPRWSHHSEANPCCTRANVEDALNQYQSQTGGHGVPGMFLVPLPALVVQTILVTMVNVIAATPNLWLTVLPSILFSGIYGYSYSFGLNRQATAS